MRKIDFDISAYYMLPTYIQYTIQYVDREGCLGLYGPPLSINHVCYSISVFIIFNINRRGRICLPSF